MHFSLVTAPTITEFRSQEEIRSKAVQKAALQPQLGILSVASILEKWGDRPHLFDVNSEYLRYATGSDASLIDGFAHHLAEVAATSNADIYGFSSICSTFPLSLRIARSLKEIRPYATILFGGPQASVVDEAIMRQFPFIDLVLRGEVEESLPLLLSELTGDYRFSNVPGLTFRDGGSLCRTPNAPIIENLDLLLPPAYHLSAYLQEATSASIELGRGCPFACTFCSTNDFFRRRFRLRSPERVLSEMRMIADRYGIRHFELVHDMFTVDRKRVVAFCEAMRSSGEGFTWDCSARTDCVDEDLLQEMAASGCRGLFFGIESGSVRVQRSIDKDLDPRKAEAMLEVCERLGIRTTASLIVGFPEEDWSDVRDTLRMYMRSAQYAGSHPQINLLAPLASTPLHYKHLHELALDAYCSDMSYQGLSQATEDLDWISRYPDIFPNFYMIPAPMLDRRVLFELREFLGMAVENFRWLLCAIAKQADLLEFHRSWMQWREIHRGAATPGEVRRYYAQSISRSDFIRFVELSESAHDPVVEALLQVEIKLMEAQRSSDLLTGSADTQPSLAQGVLVFSLNYDLTDAMHSLSGDREVQPAFCFYATRPRLDGKIQVQQISPFLAGILQQYKTREPMEIAQQIHRALGLAEDDQDMARDLIPGVLESLRRDGWLRIEELPLVEANS